ncbi:sulfotransferase family 2 domain-containing protein [Falsiroseomonas oryzae]|uniref:sulfotransferase family 2 domain-containing protein n=1 Tax=Falsiroseomonas oryzae TaxID=2766473 RepID=UPI0022EA2AA9|nr:sulfotransferase family 2 domain-containing protein [Roseomonas sp. MO-31]
MSTARQLLAGRFDAWLAPGEGPPLWLFVHVPKTAGSSLGTDLAAMPALQPYCNIHIDRTDRTDRSRTAPERYDDATEEFLAQHAAKPFRFASGHVQFRQVKRITDTVPGTRLFTMLREPVARLVSDYLYQRSPMHPLAEEVKARIPDFAAFVELKGQRNRIARHLLPPRVVTEGDVPAALEMLRNRFAFVGVQERYELGFRALTALLTGRPARPAARKRVNEGAAEEKAAVTASLRDPALQARIAELNAFDLRVHEAIAADWDRIAAPLAAWLDAREAAAAA